MMTKSTLQALASITVLFATNLGLNAQREAGSMEQVSYRTVMVEGTSIFYREAGPKGAPTILLLHGLSIVIQDVSTTADAACRQLPSDCTRLSGVRTQRLARPKTVRLHL